MSNDEYYDDYYPQVDPNLWAMQQFMLPGQGGYPESGYTPAPGYPMPTMPGPMGMQPQMDPLMYQQVMSLLQPSLTSKGKLEPYDIDYQGKIRNAQQDVYGSFDDPIWTLLSGLGSTTPEAFDDVTERKPLELKAESELRIKAAMGGIEGQIAEMVLSGMSPMSAASAVRAAIEHPDQVTGGMSQEEADNLRGQLPTTMIQKPGGFGQEEGPDWGALYKTANDIANPYIAERAMLAQPGIEYDEEGRAYTTSKKPSALQEFLQKTGIPDPRDQYGVEYYAKQNPTETMQMMERITNSESRLKDAKKAYQSFIGEDNKRKRNLAQDARQQQRYAGEMQDYTSAMAASADGRPRSMGEAATGQRAMLNQLLGGIAQPGQPADQGNDGGWLGGALNAAGSAVGIPGAAGLLEGIKAAPGELFHANAKYSPFALPGTLFNEAFANDDVQATSSGRTPAATPPNRPRLSTYSEPFQENLVQGQMRGLSNLINSKFGGSRRLGPEDNPKPLTGSLRGRGNDIKRRRQEAGAASLAMAMALAPQLALQRSGRSPINDVFQQKMQPFYASGAAGQPGMPWQYPRPPGR